MFTLLFLLAHLIYFFYVFVRFLMKTAAKIFFSASSTLDTTTQSPTINTQTETKGTQTITLSETKQNKTTTPLSETTPHSKTTPLSEKTPHLKRTPHLKLIPISKAIKMSKTAPVPAREPIKRTVHGNLSYLNDDYIRNPTEGVQFDVEEETTRAIAYMETFLKNSGLYDSDVPLKTQVHNLIDLHAYYTLFIVQKDYFTARYLSVLTWLAMEVTSYACVRRLADAYMASPSLEVLEFALCIITGVAKNRGLKYDEITLDTPSTPNQLDYSEYLEIPTANDKTETDLKTTLLIDISRFQVRLAILIPSENVDVNEDLSPSNSTETLSSRSSSKRNSLFSTSSEFTADSVDSTASSHKESNLSEDMPERLSGFNATPATLITLESTFKNIKSGIATMIDENIRGRIHSNKYKFSNYEFQSLMKNCKEMEEYIKKFKKKYACGQICLGISLYISDAMNLMESLQTKVITQKDLNQLKEVAHNSIHMVNSLLVAYEPSLFQPGEAPLYGDVQARSRVFYKQYLAIQETYEKVHDLKCLLIEGHVFLDTLCLTDRHLRHHYTTVAQDLLDVQEDVYDPAVRDLQLLVNTLHNKTQDKDYLQPYEQIINKLINSVFASMQTFKTNIMGCLIILQKFERKKEVEDKMKKASQWLIELKARIVIFYFLNNSNSKKNSASYQSQLTEFQHMHSEFTLTIYNDICNYFVQYSGEVISSFYRKKNILFDSYEMDGADDNHLEPEYILFKRMQHTCDEVSSLLSSN